MVQEEWPRQVVVGGGQGWEQSRRGAEEKAGEGEEAECAPYFRD